MRWIARVSVITASFVLGTFAVGLFGYGTQPAAAPLETQMRAEALRGTWTGNWGRSQAECTIEIDWVEGNIFYGTLIKERAEIRILGTFDPATGAIRFDETEVLTLGDYEAWSLGNNSGFISPDGHTIAGVGEDEMGSYSWSASMP